MRTGVLHERNFKAPLHKAVKRNTRRSSVDLPRRYFTGGDAYDGTQWRIDPEFGDTVVRDRALYL